jgi:hypothetical protein
VVGEGLGQASAERDLVREPVAGQGCKRHRSGGDMQQVIWHQG